MQTQEKTLFTPTSAMLSAAELLFKAMAFTEAIRPIVEGYQKEILQRHQFTNKGEIAAMEAAGLQHGRTKADVRVILDPFDDYQLSDEDFQIYLQETNDAREKAGLHVDQADKCPLLVAESMVRDAKFVLLGAMEPITKIPAQQLLGSPSTYKKVIELSLKLMGPFVADSIKN